ncbi:hypothetical protein [Algiphilus aromaticivorans]|jgi:hypothetical protein|uniref:hypothetical protein n=1 Tax=Algiphilus aromaticivorans TaxID=382454 RepID=UPI0005C13176|nr:hypothetical protein [Algiphilus aromaticivorans]
MSEDEPDSAQRKQAEAVRRACIDAALAAWEDAGISGLCAEGRWEIAIQAMRELEVETVLRTAQGDT